MPRRCGTSLPERLGGMGLFTLPEARQELTRLRPVLDEIVVVRADVVELAQDLYC